MGAQYFLKGKDYPNGLSPVELSGLEVGEDRPFLQFSGGKRKLPFFWVAEDQESAWGVYARGLERIPSFLEFCSYAGDGRILMPEYGYVVIDGKNVDEEGLFFLAKLFPKHTTIETKNALLVKNEWKYLGQRRFNFET